MLLLGTQINFVDLNSTSYYSFIFKQWKSVILLSWNLKCGRTIGGDLKNCNRFNKLIIWEHIIVKQHYLYNNIGLFICTPNSLSNVDTYATGGW